MKVRTITSAVATYVCLLGAVSVADSYAADKKDSSKYGDQAAALRQDMRKLWTDHVVWTRDYIIAALADAPDAPSALNRLMNNQDDIGNAVARFYGDSAGKQLTTNAQGVHRDRRRLDQGGEGW